MTMMKTTSIGLCLLMLVACSKDSVVAPLSADDQLIKDMALVDQAQLQKDIATIDKYLTTQVITAIKD